MVRPNFLARWGWWPDFLLLSAIWGGSFLFMRIAVVEFGPVPTAMLRAGIGALALLPLLFWRGLAGALVPHWKPAFLAGILNASIPSATASYALLFLTTGTVSVINATVPLFGALLAWLWLHQRPSRLAAVGLVCGFVGVAALAWGKAGFHGGADGYASLLAVLAVATGAASGAFSALFARRYLLGVPPLVIASGSQIGATLALAVPALVLWPSTMPGAGAWLAAAGAGVICTGLGYVLFFRLVAKAGPNRALTVTFLMPLFAMVYGFLLLDESITAGMLGCAALIIGGTALSTGVFSRRRVQPPRPSE